MFSTFMTFPTSHNYNYENRARVVRDGDAHVIELDAPGSSKEDVQVTCDASTLTIRTKRTTQRFGLSANDNVDQIKARIVNGLVTVTVPFKGLRTIPVE